MSRDTIYSDGTYTKLNPTLHAEDSVYKMSYVIKLLEKVEWNRSGVKILDIGGGAGELGKLVCDWFAANGYTVFMSALDVAEEMINVQKNNNPCIKKTYVGDIEKLGEEQFDLVLMIDVIEHIEDCEQFADRLNNYATYIIYNIPTEINLIDTLRDIAMCKRYYPLQTKSLGHVHFFSANSAARFVASHHKKIRTIFAEYTLYVLTSPHLSYVNQRKRFIRRIELMISVAIQKLLPRLAPHIVQGSLFCLAKSK